MAQSQTASLAHQAVFVVQGVAEVHGLTSTKSMHFPSPSLPLLPLPLPPPPYTHKLTRYVEAWTRPASLEQVPEPDNPPHATGSTCVSGSYCKTLLCFFPPPPLPFPSVHPPEMQDLGHGLPGLNRPQLQTASLVHQAVFVVQGLTVKLYPVLPLQCISLH